MDARTNPEAPPSPDHVATFRKDYAPPDWWVPQVALTLDLDPAETRVRAELTIVRNGAHDRPLRLAGDGLRPLSVTVDGEDARWALEGDDLVVEVRGTEATIATEVAISPETNSKLMGLYASGGILCTQCESEGFRRITFHPDRPDVLERLPGPHDRRQGALSGAAGQRQSGRIGRSATMAATGPNGTIPSPSPPICSRWSRAISTSCATISPR